MAETIGTGLDGHVRAIVRHAIAHHAIRDSDMGDGIAALHERVARALHDLALEHGSDAVGTAAEYAAAAVQAGSLYPGDELAEFLRDVSARVRASSKELGRTTPFGA